MPPGPAGDDSAIGGLYHLGFTVAELDAAVIEGAPGSPWHLGRGLRFDHLGAWSADVADACGVLVAQGSDALIDLTAQGIPMAMVDLPRTGLRIEFVEQELKPLILGPLPGAGPAEG